MNKRQAIKNAKLWYKYLNFTAPTGFTGDGTMLAITGETKEAIVVYNKTDLCRLITSAIYVLNEKDPKLAKGIAKSITLQCR